MKRMLITGFSGFVSRHFLNYLVENNLSYEVLGVDVNPAEICHGGLCADTGYVL